MFDPGWCSTRVGTIPLLATTSADALSADGDPCHLRDYFFQ